MRHIWILGGGGLLGSATKKALDGEQDITLFSEPKALRWTENTILQQQLSQAIEAFAHTIGTNESWELHWMAGRSIMSSSKAELEEETDILSFLLERIGSHKAMQETEGTIVFASSAGGIYAGSTEETICEASTVSPLSPYGEEKLQQEKLIQTWVKAHPKTSVLIARLSTLYGPNQSRGKKQGLLTHIARSILQKKPVEIFVPFDTIRDYIHVRDAALEILRCLQQVRGSGSIITKIIASEEPTTIAQIIQLFQHALRIRPRIITSSNPRSSHYARRICFRSTVLAEERSRKRTSLLCGIAEILASERLTMAKGTNCSSIQQQ